MIANKADALAEINRLLQENEKLRQQRDNHIETLRGIASMNPDTESHRMWQWAKDGLSGYVETAVSTIKTQQDAINLLTADLEITKEINNTLRKNYEKCRQDSADLWDKLRKLKNESQ